MIVTVASGKGGTGKTMVSASLATSWDSPLLAVDLDVAEPNLHLFLHPKLNEPSKAWLEIPRVNIKRCTLCGDCVELCQFKAISSILSTLTLYPYICHGCGGCIAICREKALSVGQRELGEIRQGRADTIDFLMGTLRLGEPMSPPFMEQIKKQMKQIIEDSRQDILIDAPPGASSPALCSVMDSDVIVLVTDATPFGFHDLKLAWQSFAPLHKPMGVVVNRAGLGSRATYDFCAEKNIPLLAEIPFDRSIAEAYARGQIIADVSEGLGKVFSGLRDRIRALANDCSKEAGHA